jgi:hypothetical protein
MLLLLTFTLFAILIAFLAQQLISNGASIIDGEAGQPAPLDVSPPPPVVGSNLADAARD